MSKNANYRKMNDRSHNSSTYHKKDGTPVRHLLKQEAKEEIEEIERLREDNEVLRGESQRLRDAVQDVLDFARGGDYGEIICNVEDFAALEKLIEETERGGT